MVWAMKEVETLWTVEVEWAMKVGESVMVSCILYSLFVLPTFQTALPSACIAPCGISVHGVFSRSTNELW